MDDFTTNNYDKPTFQSLTKWNDWGLMGLHPPTELFYSQLYATHWTPGTADLTSGNPCSKSMRGLDLSPERTQWNLIPLAFTYSCVPSEGSCRQAGTVVLSVFLNDSSGCLIISQRSLRLARSPQNTIKKYITRVIPKLRPLLSLAIFFFFAAHAQCKWSCRSITLLINQWQSHAQTKAWLVMGRGQAA